MSHDGAESHSADAAATGTATFATAEDSASEACANVMVNAATAPSGALAESDVVPRQDVHESDAAFSQRNSTASHHRELSLAVLRPTNGIPVTENAAVEARHHVLEALVIPQATADTLDADIAAATTATRDVENHVDAASRNAVEDVPPSDRILPTESICSGFYKQVQGVGKSRSSRSNPTTRDSLDLLPVDMTDVEKNGTLPLPCATTVETSTTDAVNENGHGPARDWLVEAHLLYEPDGQLVALPVQAARGEMVDSVHVHPLVLRREGQQQQQQQQQQQHISEPPPRLIETSSVNASSSRRVVIDRHGGAADERRRNNGNSSGVEAATTAPLAAAAPSRVASGGNGTGGGSNSTDKQQRRLRPYVCIKTWSDKACRWNCVNPALLDDDANYPNLFLPDGFLTASNTLGARLLSDIGTRLRRSQRGLRIIYVALPLWMLLLVVSFVVLGVIVGIIVSGVGVVSLTAAVCSFRPSYARFLMHQYNKDLAWYGFYVNYRIFRGCGGETHYLYIYPPNPAYRQESH